MPTSFADLKNLLSTILQVDMSADWVVSFDTVSLDANSIRGLFFELTLTDPCEYESSSDSSVTAYRSCKLAEALLFFGLWIFL